MFHSLKKTLLAISPKEASFAVRGFDCPNPELRANLEEVLRVFIAGYNLALEIHGHTLLARRLKEGWDSHHEGFAFEGAGMGCAILDLLLPSQGSRLRAFTDGPAQPHDYISTVGAGFALARLQWRPRSVRAYHQRLDPSVSWCLLDGHGFHQGFFHSRSYIDECKDTPGMPGSQAKQLFDSGIGRSLWWVKAASPERIKKAIDRFPECRRAEMWHGVGMACSYAGGIGPDGLIELVRISGAFDSHFLSGVPFSARMRQKGKNPSPATSLACRVLLRMTTDEAAGLVARYVDEVSREWKGTQRELAYVGFGRVRERVTEELRWSGKALAL